MYVVAANVTGLRAGMYRYRPRDHELTRVSGPEWMYLEAGHAAQNAYLQAVFLKLGTVVVAGFKPDAVKKELRLP